MVRFVIVRHGYSVTNKVKMFAGHLDAELDEIGVSQAQYLKNYICSNYHIDAIYSSDLKRAVDTVRPIADELGLEIKTEAGIRELDVGEWKGLLTTEVAERFPESYAVFLKDVGNAHPEGGESYSELAERTDEAFKRIAAENEGRTVLVATHGGVIRVLRCLWDGYCVTHAQVLPHVANASVSVAEYDNGRFRFVSVGYTGHLNDNVSQKDVKQLF
jgi:probable phosphoglycerate mutase